MIDLIMMKAKNEYETYKWISLMMKSNLQLLNKILLCSFVAKFRGGKKNYQCEN